MSLDLKNKINIRGVYFDNVDMESAFEKVKALVKTPGVSVMYTPNSEIVQNCVENKEMYSVINSADLLIPDGIGVIYASRILGTPLRSRVAGVEISEKLLEYASQTGDGVFFFGGGKKTETNPCVADIAARNMKEKYPGLVVSGTRDGYFTDSDNDDIVRKINESGAKILYVCLGAPKQEKWIYDHRNELCVSFAAGLGGSVDIFAGTAKRAPAFFCKTNLEWFYRLLCNPSRIGRMMSLPRFIFGTIIHRNKGCE